MEICHADSRSLLPRVSRREVGRAAMNLRTTRRLGVAMKKNLCGKQASLCLQSPAESRLRSEIQDLGWTEGRRGTQRKRVQFRKRWTMHVNCLVSDSIAQQQRLLQSSWSLV